MTKTEKRSNHKQTVTLKIKGEKQRVTKCKNIQRHASRVTKLQILI